MPNSSQHDRAFCSGFFSSTWWSRLLTRMVRLLLFFPHTPASSDSRPRLAGPFRLWIYNQTASLQPRAQYCSEDSSARHVAVPLLARMVRLLFFIHHAPSSSDSCPSLAGPSRLGHITKLPAFSLIHENLSEDSTARHVVAPFTLAFMLPWLSHVRARRTWAQQRRGRAAGQLHGGTRHSYNHYGWHARGP